MRRKTHPKPDTIISAEILERAKQSISPDSLKKRSACSVCGGETSAAGQEPLCWVCRRLKISAWKEVEQQLPAQE